jgi:hypothetical protein
MVSLDDRGNQPHLYNPLHVSVRREGEGAQRLGESCYGFNGLSIIPIAACQTGGLLSR